MHICFRADDTCHVIGKIYQIRYRTGVGAITMVPEPFVNSQPSIGTQVCRRRYLRTIFLYCQLGSAAFSQGVISGRHFLCDRKTLSF